MNTFTCANLISMGRHIPTPFHVSVSKDRQQIDLCIESILRIVPGKRIVGLSQWQNRQVIVKLFYQSGRWKHSLLADINGVNLLAHSRIPTPKILHQATLADNRGAVLLIEYLDEGTSLMSLLDEAVADADRRKLLEMAIESIANCHKAGILQKDIHLDNSMFSNGRVYLLDGGDIKGARNGIKPETKLANLAMFFAQFPVTMDHNIGALLRHYLAQGVDVAADLVDGFDRRLKEARSNRLARYERKLFRSTTAIRCVQTSTKFLVYDRNMHSHEFGLFVKNPDTFIERGKILKNGNSATVVEVSIAGRAYVLKRYNIKKFAHGLRSLFKSGRAYNSWRNALVLKMLGVATPHPYVFMEHRVLWIFRRRSYFLCERIEAEHLTTNFESAATDKIGSDELLAAFQRLLEIMNDYKISHGDMKASNFIYANKLLYVLDLDFMQRHKTALRFHNRFAKDLARFRKNWIGTRLEAPVEQLIEKMEASRGKRAKVR